MSFLRRRRLFATAGTDTSTRNIMESRVVLGEKPSGFALFCVNAREIGIETVN